MGETYKSDVILLFDFYGQESQNLRTSFALAGVNIPAVVIEDDGFLPEDVMSVYGFFLGDFKSASSVPGNFGAGNLTTVPGNLRAGNQTAVPGRPRYFNQITVPDYWEITASNAGGKIMDHDHERGRIFYTEPTHKRLVKVVDWLDERGVVRSSDYYNRYGALYARTIFNAKGQKVNKSYFSADGKEVIVENYVTGDIILNEDGKVRFFPTKTDFVLHFLSRCGHGYRRLFFNSLSTPFFVSERLAANDHGDVLFWNEPARPDIPGNMQIILNGSSRRTGHIYVQKKKAYEKLLALGAHPQMVTPKGYIYPFERENHGGSQALICTNSDNILNLKQLVEALPQLHFHIAAITEMSSKLMAMERYANVSLYPGIKNDRYEELLAACDIYLDINYEREILSATRRAFLNDQIIFAFRETMHGADYTAAAHIYTGKESAGAQPAPAEDTARTAGNLAPAQGTSRMIADITAVLENQNARAAALARQHEAALAEEPAAYGAKL
jgi:accessory Sec system glycosyltransferase GtfB